MFNILLGSTLSPQSRPFFLRVSLLVGWLVAADQLVSYYLTYRSNLEKLVRTRYLVLCAEFSYLICVFCNLRPNFLQIFNRIKDWNFKQYPTPSGLSLAGLALPTTCVSSQLGKRLQKAYKNEQTLGKKTLPIIGSSPGSDYTEADLRDKCKFKDIFCWNKKRLCTNLGATATLFEHEANYLHGLVFRWPSQVAAEVVHKHSRQEYVGLFSQRKEKI